MTRTPILKALWLFKNSLTSHLGLLFLFSIPVVKAQENRYFPQEQLVFEECENKDDPNRCLESFFEKRVSTFLNSKKLSKYLLKFEKDTLITGGDLVVDINGAVQQEKSYVAIKGMKLNKKLKTAFRELFYNTVFQKVLFYKNAPNTSVHPFYFKYVVTKTDGIPNIVLVENDKPYEGGVIREVPKFPGCEGLPSEKAQLCFQTQIERHIKGQFKYPPLAFEKGISGTVSIVFIISKEGKVENIRTKGPDALLEDEARRLVKLLPRFQPALENGIPVKIPFSIPIYFRL